MSYIFIVYLACFLFTVSCFYLAGHGLFKILGININDLYASVFAKIISSCVLFVIGISVVVTGGITLNILFVIPILYFALRYSNRNKILLAQSFPSLAQLLALTIGAILIFIFRYGQIYNHGSQVPLAPHGDITFYANCIDFIFNSGNENSSVNYLHPAGTSPYHYFELWLGGGISRIFSLNTALTLQLIAFSIGPFILWTGLCAMISSLKRQPSQAFYFVCFY